MGKLITVLMLQKQQNIPKVSFLNAFAKFLLILSLSDDRKNLIKKSSVRISGAGSRPLKVLKKLEV